MRHSAIECQSFAGAYALGASRAGFQIQGFHDLGHFGEESKRKNQRLLQSAKDAGFESGPDPRAWTPQEAPYLFGNPPCSAYSYQNRFTRGAQSDRTAGMRALVDYAGDCSGSDGHLGPEFVVFECVQPAFKEGRRLMRAFRDRLEKKTRRKYALTHVLMSAAMAGSAQQRPRYYWVAHDHRLAFRVQRPWLPRVATYRDAINDLASAFDESADANAVVPPRERPSAWARAWALPGGDAWILQHQRLRSPHARRVEELARCGLMPAGRRLKNIVGDRRIKWPCALRAHYTGRLSAKSAKGGFGAAVRVSWDQAPLTVYGVGDILFVHPDQDRILTLREQARLMGFPDAWDFTGARGLAEAHAWLGKGVTVQSAWWISEWVQRALDAAAPPPDDAQQSVQIGRAEYLVDASRPRLVDGDGKDG